MKSVELSPWGDADFEEVRSVTLTFLGEEYSYRVLKLTPAPIDAALTERESETLATVYTQPDPND